MEIAWYTAEPEPLGSLFALAEDSPQRLEASLGQGLVLVATDDGQIVAYLQLVESDAKRELELRSVAVVDERQRRGIGRALIERAIAEGRAQGVHTLVVATRGSRSRPAGGRRSSRSNARPTRPTRPGARARSPETAHAGWRPARLGPTARQRCRRGGSTPPIPTHGWSRRSARRRSRATTPRRRSRAADRRRGRGDGAEGRNR